MRSMSSWSPPPKSRRERFQQIFALGIFRGGVSRYAAIPLIVTLYPGHSDITTFRPWSPIATGNHLDRDKRKNYESCSNDWHGWCFRCGVRHFGATWRRGSACPNLHEWWTKPAHVRCAVAQLLIYPNFGWGSSKISYWISSIISAVVTLFDRPWQRATKVEKSPHLNWVSQFMTLAYDGACSPNVSVRIAWISYGALIFRGEENLMSTTVSMLSKSRAWRDMLRFRLCNKKILAIRHTKISLFPTTLSNPSYDIGNSVEISTG
jgi:hypothetical protein